MNKQLHKIEKFRNYVLQEIDGLTTEQLNAIPGGFNNNIIWNLGHLISASQMIFYRRGGLDLTIDEKYITPFLTSTKPGKLISSTEINIIKNLAASTITAMQTDLKTKGFNNYIKSENIERVYGLETLTIQDAIEFLLYHEGYHAAKITTIKQFVFSK